MQDKSYALRYLNQRGIEKIKEVHKIISNGISNQEYKRVLENIEKILFDDKLTKE